MSDEFWSTVTTIASTREANVETWLVLPLLEALGHDRTCIDSKVPIFFQEGRNRQPGRKPEADFVVYSERPFGRATSLIVVEAKRTDEPIDGGREQGESYAQNLRAPILLMTNGLRLEVWQIQIMTDSVRVFDCALADLPNRRGDLESLLSREAIRAHCASIEFKRFDRLAQDLGAYERAEQERFAEVARTAIPRNLHDVGTKRSVGWTELLAERGAVVTGSSGYGKTTLAASLLFEGLERSLEGKEVALPIDVFLPDLTLGGRTFEDFLADRVASHKPGFSSSMLCDLARARGLLVVADGFERVALDRRDRIKSVLRTLLRDYPKAQLFVMSRANAAPSDLGLPLVNLSGYTPEDLQELAQRLATTYPNAVNAFARAPDHVYRIAEVPLLANLVLDRYEHERKHTSRIASLYEAWLNNILVASGPIDRALDRALLEKIAHRTTDGPIAIEEAMGLVERRSDPERLLSRLAEADAINVRGATIELHHEALADYLRALRFWSTSPTPRAADLAALSFDPSSQFATLLVATAPNVDQRSEAWRAVAKVSLKLAIGSLRFAAGSETLGVEAPNDDARRLLRDIREAIETLITEHFGPIAGLLREEITGAPIELLGIRGGVGTNFIEYSFFEAKDAREPIRLAPRQEQESLPKIYGHALKHVGYGPEVGRVLGTQRLKDALLGLVKNRRLKGGPIWIEERVAGRLRHLVQAHETPISNCTLQEVYTVLESQADAWVLASGLQTGQEFPIRELLGDIAWLMNRGMLRIDPWWCRLDRLDLHSIEGQSCFGRILDEYHRRRQLAYAEIVEHSFPALRPHLRTLRMMPLRLEIEAEFYTKRGFEDLTLQHRRWPVATYDEAGAEITFPLKKSDFYSETAVREYVDKTDALLTRFGRYFPERSVKWGGTQIPDLRGEDTSFDGLPHESAVVRGAANWLKEDLEDVFSEIPSH